MKSWVAIFTVTIVQAGLLGSLERTAYAGKPDQPAPARTVPGRLKIVWPPPGEDATAKETSVTTPAAAKSAVPAQAALEIKPAVGKSAAPARESVSAIAAPRRRQLPNAPAGKPSRPVRPPPPERVAAPPARVAAPPARVAPPPARVAAPPPALLPRPARNGAPPAASLAARGAAPAAKKSEAKRLPTETELSRALGFANLGNTCFANASLKLLAAAVADRIDIYNPPDVAAGPLSRIDAAERDARRAFHLLISQLSRNDVSLAPQSDYHRMALDIWFDALKGYLRATNVGGGDHLTIDRAGARQYIGTHQIDAHEFLVKVADAIGFAERSELLRLAVVSEFAPPFGQETTPPAISDEVDQTSFLTLPVTRDTRSVEGAFQAYIAAERITPDNARHDPTPADRLEIARWRAPLDTGQPIRNVIVELGRHSFDRVRKVGVKVSTPIDPTIAFSIPRYDRDRLVTHGTSGSLVNEDLVILRAVVVHGGSATGGHYVAYVRDDIRQSWMLHNDREVTPVTEAQMIARAKVDGYIFLYQAPRQ